MKKGHKYNLSLQYANDDFYLELSINDYDSKLHLNLTMNGGKKYEIPITTEQLKDFLKTKESIEQLIKNNYDSNRD